MTRRWTVRLSVGLIAVMALVGCSDKQEASESLPSASSSAAPTEEELPPLGPEDMPMPDEARTQDAAGAEAFVRYYFDLINRTTTVMDAQPLRDLSDGCRDCDRIADNVEREAAAGNDYEEGELTITGIGNPVMKDATADLPLLVDQAPLVVLNSAGQPTAGGTGSYTGVPAGAGLRWDASRQSWLMTDLTFG